jgi:hypothetical protein
VALALTDISRRLYHSILEEVVTPAILCRFLRENQ